MNKLRFLCCCLLLGPLSIFAQERVYFDFGCNFNASPTSGFYTLNDANAEAKAIVDTIFRLLHMPKSPLKLKAAEGVANAQATMRGNDRYILYSNDFIQKFQKEARTTWATYVVFAHEIGHHLRFHNLSETNPTIRQEMEMEADVYAAQILALMGANETDALAALNTLVEEKSAIYPKKTERIAAMRKAYQQQRADMGKIGATIEISQRTEISLDAQSFNRWAIVKKENIKSTIDGDKVEIQLNSIPDVYANKKLSIRLESLDGERVQTVDGVGDYLKYEPQKTIVWRYAVDGVLKNTASRSDRLRIHVYTMGNRPHKSAGVLWGILTTAVGTSGIVYSFIERNNALQDYAIYKENRIVTANIYKAPNLDRDGVYQKANNPYIQSQYFLGGGLVVAIMGVLMIRQGVKVNQEARDLGFATVSDKRKWFIEPLVTTNNFGQSSVGLRLRF